jgi:putative ABC transport system permease protein
MKHDPRVQEEIDFHIEQQTAKNIRAGMSPEEARRDALVRFGGRQASREAAKDAALGTAARDFIRDLRIAFRTLGRTPSFAVTAILTFALGLGASTAMFAVVKGVLLQPMPYPDSDRIVRLYQLGTSGVRGHVSHPNFEDWKQGTRSFEHMTEMQIHGRVTVLGAGEPQLLSVTFVSAEFFNAMRVRPERGRGFAPADQTVGAAPVAIVSASVWERLGNRPQPAGERLTVGPLAAAVVGVMPKGFDYPNGTAIWMPLDMIERNPNRTGHNYQPLARLRDGVSLEAAQAEISALSRRLKTQHGDATWMNGCFWPPCCCWPWP